MELYHPVEYTKYAVVYEQFALILVELKRIGGKLEEIDKEINNMKKWINQMYLNDDDHKRVLIELGIIQPVDKRVTE